MTISIGTPTTLTIAKNGLEFDYCNPIAGAPTSYRDVTVGIDLTDFFLMSNPSTDAHAICAFDTSGDNKHNFPIVRNGQRLWSDARGLIFYPDGRIKFERWVPQATAVCGNQQNVQMRPSATLQPVRGAGGPVYTRYTVRAILALDGSIQYNITAYDAGWTNPTHVAWGQQTAASLQANVPLYTGRIGLGLIDGFTGDTCPEPTQEPNIIVNNPKKNVTVNVLSYSQV
ncbi:MAG: hypothetical protein QE485_10760 [Acidovorax sp.]|uniref:hypothetical protein n=1 Tax=Acidovorax sp. TaxID=1872122 RepID=UPI002603BEB4|nr:hypothetical protein [Acidovorax sp.]MDH4417696.1 hypothetical protein [Acidovorax sp.]